MKILYFMTFLFTQTSLLAKCCLQPYQHNVYGNLQFRLLEGLRGPVGLKSLLWGGVAGSSEGLEIMGQLDFNKLSAGVLHQIGSLPSESYGFITLSPFSRLQIVGMVPKNFSILGTYLRFKALHFQLHSVQCSFALQFGSVFNLPIREPIGLSLQEDVKATGFCTWQVKLGWLTFSAPCLKDRLSHFQVGLSAPESNRVNIFEARKSLNQCFGF